VPFRANLGIKMDTDFYNTAAWRQLRSHQLAVEPLCRMCFAEGRTTAANTVDHITPHRGDPDLFWAGSFQSLCATCHSRFKQSQESGGVKHLTGCDAQGEPLFFEW
jgi:5-methylcytosine-specific restriction enzyme A